MTAAIKRILRHRAGSLLGPGLLSLLFACFNVQAAEDGHHPHHVALAGGISWHDSKNSAYLGADYVYSWENGWGVGGFYEEVTSRLSPIPTSSSSMISDSAGHVERNAASARDRCSIPGR